MSRRPLIAGNWKMHLDHLEAIALVQRLAYMLEPADFDAMDIAVLPPFTALRSVQTFLDAERVPMALGAQNCHWEDAGAYTGEISPPMLAKLTVRYVLCGHSERRAMFGESDEVVNRKVRAVLRHELTPVLCVGETLEQREAGEAAKVVVGQLGAGLEGVSADAVAGMVVAYEPVWAIGTGKTATPEEANEMCGLVRSTVGEQFGAAAGDALRVQYGGSVKPGNARVLLGQPEIDGALVGGASLDADDFTAICRYPRRRG